MRTLSAQFALNLGSHHRADMNPDAGMLPSPPGSLPSQPDSMRNALRFILCIQMIAVGSAK